MKEKKIAISMESKKQKAVLTHSKKEASTHLTTVQEHNRGLIYLVTQHNPHSYSSVLLVIKCVQYINTNAVIHGHQNIMEIYNCTHYIPVKYT